VTADGISVGPWLIPDSDLIERFETSGGPGGQHANRNETAVTLRFEINTSGLPDDVKQKLEDRLGPMVEVVASDTRSQFRNREVARARLAVKLETALADPKPRRKTKPSKSARERRLREKRARSDLKRNRQTPSSD
jgi:ribosome-associated protein